MAANNKTSFIADCRAVIAVVTLTYSATILARQTILDDGRIRLKHVVRK
jgi:hypothetical protein